MTPRLNYAELTTEPLKGMYALEKYVRTCGLDPILIHLVKIRASQINGCAFCLEMHCKEARAHGEQQQRLDTLSAWRETPFFEPREQAALAWTEAVTNIQAGVPDAIYQEAREHFSEKELVDLTWAIVAINTWNRMAISFHAVPGSYKAPRLD